MNQDCSTKHLAQLIHKKHDLLNQIQGMVKRQSERIEQNKVVELMPLLAAKQKLLDELHNVEDKLHPYRDQDPDSRQWESESARQECASLVETNRMMLRSILEEEQRCEKRLQTQRERTKQALENHDSAADAMRAYNQPDQPRQNRLDLSSE